MVNHNKSLTWNTVLLGIWDPCQVTVSSLSSIQIYIYARIIYSIVHSFVFLPGLPTVCPRARRRQPAKCNSVAKVKNAKKMNALPWSWKVRLGAVQFQWFTLIYCINWCCLMFFVKLKCSTPNQKVEHYDGLKLLQHEKQNISRVLTKCGKRWLITKWMLVDCWKKGG